MDLHITRFVAAVAVIASVGLGACSSDKASSKPATTTPAGATTPAGDTTPAAGGAAVTIENLTFTVPASVKAGETITVTNNDSFGHTFSDSGGAFSVDVPGGGSATVVVKDAGTYAVVCHIHSSMKTTLVVN